MEEHYVVDDNSSYPKTRAEVVQSPDWVLEALMAECSVDPGEPDECLACFAYRILSDREQEAKPDMKQIARAILNPADPDDKDTFESLARLLAERVLNE
jgi:hypothetical protein